MGGVENILKLNRSRSFGIKFLRIKPMRGQVEKVRIFYKDESGASSMEYCILIACIAVAIVSAINIFGSAVQALFTNSNAKLPLH
jgi:Flp pilus assembly pilin Flp